MKKTIIISSIVILLGTAVFFYIKKQQKLIEDTGFSINYISGKSISKGVVTINLNMNVRNKSDFAYNVTSAKVDAYINNVLVGTAKTDARYDVPARGSINGDITAVLDLNKVKASVTDIISAAISLGDAQIKLVCSIGIKKAGIPFNVPFTYNTSIKEILA